MFQTQTSALSLRGADIRGCEVLLTKNQAEFAKVQENEVNNAKLMREVQSVMKRMHFNIARLVIVDPKEIMKPNPVEASHLEVPKTIGLQSIVPPITQAQAGTTSMGPPLPISKEEMKKRFAPSPIVVSDLNVKIPQSGPRQTSSRDTVLSKDKTQQAIKTWEDTAQSSKQPQIVKRKTPEGRTDLVQEIDRDTMMFPEYNLKEYYWIEKDELKRLESPCSKGIREERLERGRGSIHYTNFNPIKRLIPKMHRSFSYINNNSNTSSLIVYRVVSLIKTKK
ncbi:hypothetical protein Hanom_Chr13g01243431 [Helianthus anomalus]